jgi:Exostosin family
MAKVGSSCEYNGDCFYYELSRRMESAHELSAWPGVEAAARDLGYGSMAQYGRDARFYIEAVYAVSTFCLMPPGDTPKRRGFVDAMMMGCIPVCFMESSRAYPWYLSDEELAATTVLIPYEQFRRNWTMLHDHLRSLLPQVPSMQAAIARHVTSLQYSYSEMGPEDHVLVGPDAVDVFLHRMVEQNAEARR